jgi:flagellum-specific peptidoglycan hydrolase FlgJ
MTKVSGSTTASKTASLKAQEQKELEALKTEQEKVDQVLEQAEKSAPDVKNLIEQGKQQADHQFSLERSAIEAKFAKELQTPTKPQSKGDGGNAGKSGTNKTDATKPMPKSSNPFINDIASGAVASQAKYGVPASVTMAQAILESGWGKSGLSKEAHNLFGIKGQGPAGSVTMPTQEFENGHYVTVNAAFRKYHNDAESIEDHAKLLATSSYYKKAMADKGNPNKFADDLTGVYATDPNYGKQLQQIMKQYNLYQYDDPKLAGGTKSGGTEPKPKPAPKPEPKPKSNGTSKSGGNYTVKSGDTLSLIASRHGVSLGALEKANPQLKDPNKIFPGEVLHLPGGSKSTSTSGSHKTGGTSKTGGTEKKSGGSSSKGNAADVARGFLGWTEYKLQPSGKLDMDQWVPKNVDCANFVSGCLEKAGLISHSQRSDNVVGLANNLRKDGWKDVPLKDAKPGDVVCFDGPEGNYQHVEIFNGWVNGKPQFIGSNNVLSDGTQEVTTDTGSWAYRFHVLQPS